MMKAQLTLTFALLLTLLTLGTPAWAAKVQICHVPPGNPDNFHTITVSDNAVQAHLGHGDLLGACFEHCEQLCDDGNACTIDACDDAEHCVATHPPVSCDDGNLCTVDSCDPATGCAATPKVCQDGALCTVDTCDPLTGNCAFPPVACPAGQTCNTSNGNCEGAPPTDGCPEPPPGTTCPCVGASADFANTVGIPGSCNDFGTFIFKDTGDVSVSASCEDLMNPDGGGFCSVTSGFNLDTTAVEGTVCVRLIRQACTP